MDVGAPAIWVRTVFAVSPPSSAVMLTAPERLELVIVAAYLPSVSSDTHGLAGERLVILVQHGRCHSSLRDTIGDYFRMCEHDCDRREAGLRGVFFVRVYFGRFGYFGAG
jgi:hypothetical protein